MGLRATSVREGLRRGSESGTGVETELLCSVVIGGAVPRPTTPDRLWRVDSLSCWIRRGERGSSCYMSN